MQHFVIRFSKNKAISVIFKLVAGNNIFSYVIVANSSIQFSRGCCGPY